MRKFNVTGIGVPDLHYMVDTTEKVEAIFKMVEDKKYFTINRGRQFGKTTTIGLLENRILQEDYVCASISFQFSNERMFANETGFCQELLEMIHESIYFYDPEEAKKWVDPSVIDFKLLSRFITNMCRNSPKKIVLIIDESDRASNNDIFIMFIGMLREKFLRRSRGKDFTFHSVILAGVYDIKNIKQRILLTGKYTPSTGESSTNSPWNIAADFKVDMSFSAKEIETMLAEYENDRHTGMNMAAIAQEIRFYTSGYPYLVSRICLLIDTDLNSNWTLNGVQEAVRLILKEHSTLFDDMFKKIEDRQDLKNLLYDLTMRNIKYQYNVDNFAAVFGIMFGFLAKDTEYLQIHNKIFEIRISNYFILDKALNGREENIPQTPLNEIIKDNSFNMELCLKKFQKHYAEIYTSKDEKFLEHDGKLIFLTYLKPLINGTGFYHFESETRDSGKMDLVIDYMKQQFILELKLWYGDRKHEEAYEQLAGYLASKNMDCGYLLTFDFRKQGDDHFAEPKWVEYDGKRIFDVVLRVGK
jgi:hypothetical protein